MRILLLLTILFSGGAHASEYFNLWLAISDGAKTQYAARKDQGDAYRGPMTDRAFRIFDAISDNGVERLYKSPSIGGKTYFLFSTYIDRADAQAAQSAVDYLTTNWPNDVIIVGAWREDGSCVRPVHAQAWRLMPDVTTYDENGEIVSTIVASSNADLTQVNTLYGQAPRDMTCV